MSDDSKSDETASFPAGKKSKAGWRKHFNLKEVITGSAIAIAVSTAGVFIPQIAQAESPGDMKKLKENLDKLKNAQQEQLKQEVQNSPAANNPPVNPTGTNSHKSVKSQPRSPYYGEPHQGAGDPVTVDPHLPDDQIPLIDARENYLAMKGLLGNKADVNDFVRIYSNYRSTVAPELVEKRKVFNSLIVKIHSSSSASQVEVISRLIRDFKILGGNWQEKGNMEFTLSAVRALLNVFPVTMITDPTYHISPRYISGYLRGNVLMKHIPGREPFIVYGDISNTIERVYPTDKQHPADLMLLDNKNVRTLQDITGVLR